MDGNALGVQPFGAGSFRAEISSREVEPETVMTMPVWIARDREDADRRTASLAAIVIVLLLLIGGLMLTKMLHKKSMLGDCLMAGRRDCDHLVNGPG